MGMQQTVRFDNEVIPAWETVQAFLDEKRYPVQMRMINGELAFPEDVPPDDWREIRIGTAQGMVTLQRRDNEIVFVTWGNADDEMRQAWNALAWTYAKLGLGSIDSEAGSATADEFEKSADLPSVLVE